MRRVLLGLLIGAIVFAATPAWARWVWRDGKWQYVNDSQTPPAPAPAPTKPAPPPTLTPPETTPPTPPSPPPEKPPEKPPEPAPKPEKPPEAAPPTPPAPKPETPAPEPKPAPKVETPAPKPETPAPEPKPAPKPETPAPKPEPAPAVPAPAPVAPPKVEPPPPKPELPAPKPEPVEPGFVPAKPRTETLPPTVEAPAPKPAVPAPSPAAPTPRIETPAPRPEAPAPRIAPPAPKAETPFTRPETPAPRPEAPAPKAVPAATETRPPAAKGNAPAPSATEQFRNWWDGIAKPSDETMLFERARSAMSGKDYRSAARDFKALLKNFPASRNREEVMWLRAAALMGLEDHMAAFEQYEELITNYAGGPHYRDSLLKEIEIADIYLGPTRRKVLGIPLTSGDTEAVEILRKVYAHQPTGDLADNVVRKIADYYWSKEQWTEAEDYYDKYCREYPNGPAARVAELRRAKCAIEKCRGSRYDTTSLQLAYDRLRQFKQKFPEDAEREGVPAQLAKIREMQAEALYETAINYYRSGKPLAAAYYVERLQQKFSDTIWCEMSRQFMADISMKKDEHESQAETTGNGKEEPKPQAKSEGKDKPGPKEGSRPKEEPKP